MTPADNLTARLDGVKSTGPDRWISHCPAHDDRNPSLTIRQAEDGRLLIHCFAGCGAADVLAAVGLSFADLFPKSEPDYARIEKTGTNRERRPFFPSDILRCIADEALLTATAAANLAHGVELTQEDRGRLLTAAERLQEAVRYATA